MLKDVASRILTKIKKLANAELGLLLAEIAVYVTDKERAKWRQNARHNKSIKKSAEQADLVYRKALAELAALEAHQQTLSSQLQQRHIVQLEPVNMNDSAIPPEGANAIVSFYSAQNVQVLVENQPIVDEEADVLPVVYLHPKSSAKTISCARQVRMLMRTKKVPADFNQFQLYHDKKGRVISIRANKGDLGKFIDNHKRNLGWSTVKDLIGQILLAVSDLHERNIVHRDIKPENILVFFYNGKYLIKLHDHDGGAEIKSSNQLVDSEPGSIDGGTLAFLAPEVGAILKRTNPEDYSITNFTKLTRDQLKAEMKRYAELDFKKIDSFSVGKTINELLATMKNQTSIERVAVNRLVSDLINGKMTNRITCQKAMEMPLFGDTPEKRTEFFARLRVDAKRHVVQMDGADYEPVDEEDPYYLLDRSIKPVYTAAKRYLQVADQLEDCNQQIKIKCSDGTFSKIVDRFDLLNLHNKQLSKAVDQAAYHLKIAEFLQSPDELNKLGQDAKIQVKSVWQALLNDNDAMTTLLKKAVDEAYLDYVRVNKLEDEHGDPILGCFDFFAVHGQKGRAQANQLKARIADKYDAKAVFDVIHDHFDHQGGRRWQHSFKTFLNNKLLRLSNNNLEQWAQHFTKIDISHERVNPSGSLPNPFEYKFVP